MNERLPSLLPDSLPWSINPLREVEHSIIQLSSGPSDPHWSLEDEDLYSEAISESPLEKLRSILKTTQGNVSQCEDVVNNIASSDEDIKQKCETIAVINLLPQNVILALSGDFSVISVAVDILIKYGSNLLTPKRNPNWRSIKSSNVVFRTKVQPLKGYENILREFGYTEQNEGSFDFPAHVEKPDMEKVAVVTADLLILQRELSQFCNETHVNKERFLECFSHRISDEGAVLSPRTRDGITLERPCPQQQSYQQKQVPSEDCAMCEGKPGIIHCDTCQSARCEPCDRQWHSYPKKRSHPRTLLVKVEEESDVEQERTKEESQEECFICGIKATIRCVTCPDFFCPGCEERFHRSKERLSHGRIKMRISKKTPPEMKLGLSKNTSMKSQEEYDRKVRNLSYRLSVFCKEAQRDGYTLEDVKTALDILENEGEPTMSPIELHGITSYIIQEFSQKYNVMLTSQNPDIVSQREIHETWLRNGCDRKITATECLKLLYMKVEELHATYQNSEKIIVVLALMQNGFNLHKAKCFLDRQNSQNDVRTSQGWTKQATATLTAETIEEIERSCLPERKKKEKITQKLMAEHGISKGAVDAVFILREEEFQFELAECIEAVKQADGNLHRARKYFKECDICYTVFGMHKLVTLPTCQCLVCTECFTQHFTHLAKTTPCMYKFSCPVCDEPDLEHCDPEMYQTYFAYLGTMLRNFLTKQDYEVYESKLATWGLIGDPNFRWCAHGCGAGFINERNQIIKLQCPECRKYQCFSCKKQWLDQHDDISCEEFDAWKRANDPDFQQQGLAAHLKENGINCPKCKMRYELGKGGCMHFKCTQCHFEFCCGCNLPFRHYPACNLQPSCNGKGLHAHHPRDCFYYLRDEECRDLQKLLQKHGVNYNQSTNDFAAAGERPAYCQVTEQHETPNGLEDGICGKPLKDHCGLCENHYKEYLVGLINQHNIDPVDIFGLDSLQATLRRNDKQIPNRAGNEADAAYAARLRQEIKRQLPLRPRNALGV